MSKIDTSSRHSELLLGEIETVIVTPFTFS